MTTTPTSSSTTAASTTRTGREAALDFRVLLDALANPGRIDRFDLSDTDLPAAIVPVAALIDVEVALSVLASAEDSAWAERLRMATGARIVEHEQADLVLALREITPAEVATLRRGDAWHPEHGARLVLAVRSLTADPGRVPGTVMITTSGPGVPGERSVSVSGLAVEVISAINEANATPGFPAGIDLFLVADNGAVVGLPRSNRLLVRVNEGSN